MVKINFTESKEMRKETMVDGEESNFVGFVTRIMGITWIENKDRFVFLIFEGVVVRNLMCMDTIFRNIIYQIHLHQIIIIRGSIAWIGVLDLFTNDPLIGDFRFEINATSYVKLIPITLGVQDFPLLPNIKIEIDSENEE
ncbi:hypothetical protein KQX54_000644 [Cotesia glomerata]|uniref:Uncharacterized protein n=1 Tax=Cotesia glomerata TaxID=32391 RepID=A0AAV7J0N2_COTGL|nr:hypothetical protein KQX54_000644 [Cotesia glomerata]